MDLQTVVHISLSVVLLVKCAYCVDYTSSLVFDPWFYIQTNYDLQRAGITTPEKAKTHWLSDGIKQGRQGCGSFHSKQYLARYNDLSHAFGHNYTAAIKHYLTFHNKEHRYGYKEGGYNGRWTISNHKDIFISASARMGGAIDSLVWNNRELINAHDHGRELQMACNTNTYGECFNPTEAGGRDDSNDDSTKTHINWVRAHGNVLESEINPSFWLRPGTHETAGYGACSKGSPALNREATYLYKFWKKVTIGVHGVPNCIEFISNFTIGGSWPHDGKYIQMEAPTGYMPGDFEQKYTYNIHKTVMENYHDHHQPVALATQDHNYAMGAYAPAGQDTDKPVHYSAHNFDIKGFVSDTNKWNIVFYKRLPVNGTLNQIYRAYICVGTLSMVSQCLNKITTAVPRV